MRIKDNLGLRRGIQIKIYQVLNHEGGGGSPIAMVVGKLITR